MRMILIVFLALICPFIAAFTCQGGIGNCPDRGNQAATIGGNVTITVLYATNLPNRDVSGPAAGVSDPYVKFKVGTEVTRVTDNVRNNLNPVWNEKVNLGYLQSSTEIIVEIWDKDGGLEFADDRLTRGKVNVPFCSSFSSYAHNVQETCGETFGCSVDDSLWAMPQRKRCNETGSIMFSNSQSCDSPGAVCLFLEIIIVPFIMKVSKFVHGTKLCFLELILLKQCFTVFLTPHYATFHFQTLLGGAGQTWTVRNRACDHSSRTNPHLREYGSLDQHQPFRLSLFKRPHFFAVDVVHRSGHVQRCVFNFLICSFVKAHRPNLWPIAVFSSQTTWFPLF